MENYTCKSASFVRREGFIQAVNNHAVNTRIFSKRRKTKNNTIEFSFKLNSPKRLIKIAYLRYVHDILKWKKYRFE